MIRRDTYHDKETIEGPSDNELEAFYRSVIYLTCSYFSIVT